MSNWNAPTETDLLWDSSNSHQGSPKIYCNSMLGHIVALLHFGDPPPSSFQTKNSDSSIYNRHHVGNLAPGPIIGWGITQQYSRYTPRGTVVPNNRTSIDVENERGEV